MTYDVYLEAPAVGRSDPIAEGVELQIARATLVRMTERMRAKFSVERFDWDVWITPEGTLCEGVRWTMPDPHALQFAGYIAHP